MSKFEKLLSCDRMLNRENYRSDPAYWTDVSPWGIVSTAHYQATKAGLKILADGGNAIDAAIAVSLALGVAEPAGSGLGGMGLMLVHMAERKKTFFIEGSCRAPVKAIPEEVVKSERYSGYKAIAVPMLPAVLEHAYNYYGTLNLSDLFKPAIILAEEGFPLTGLYCGHLEHYQKGLIKNNTACFFLDSGNKPFSPGNCFKQPVLAGTLQRLSEKGFNDFYSGDIGREILQDMKRNGGFISEDDFITPPVPGETGPLIGRFRNCKVYTLPPPGGGTTLLQMLQTYDRLENVPLNPNSPEAAVLMALIIQQARLDRRTYRLGQSNVPGKKIPDLASLDYAAQVAESVISRIDEIGETTHFCIMDKHGNVVSMTQSIERSFGAQVATENLGFLYNGYIKGFKIKNKKHPHYLKPGAVARSNAAPTILMKNDLPYVAIGSTGSERMLSGIFQVLVRLRYQSPFEAVAAPRLHCTPEGEIFLEADRFSPKALDELDRYGFKLTAYDAWSFKVGGLQLAVAEDNLYKGVAEPRRDGAAAGPEKKPVSYFH